MKKDLNKSPEDVLNFWFEEIEPEIWFNSTSEFDIQLKTRFEPIFMAAMDNELADWEKTPQGSVALVIVLDQFPLNMYRGQPESFAGESKSREVARRAIEKEFDHRLADEQKAFLYMPFMHSENLQDQNLSVTLFEKAGLKHNLRFAKHHREIIKQYGRFPHRNDILGRESTPAEIDYLNSKEAFLG